MLTPLLRLLTGKSTRGRRPFGLLAGALLAVLAAAPQAQAQIVYGLSGTDLTSVNLASPFTSQTRQPIVGIAPGQALVGLDFRPATGELFALGYDAAATGPNARLYVITQNTATATATATAVGAAAIRLELGGAAERVGFDFNPTVDRIRVVSTNDANYRLHPVTGAIAAIDGTLAFAPADQNAGQNPFVGTAAYTNSYIGATSTTLYVIDEQRAQLLTQIPPNAGTLNTVANINPTAGGNPAPINAPGASTDLDIFAFGPNDEQAYLNVNQVDGSGNFIALLFRLNLATGATTFAGAVNGAGIGITDIAVRINRTAPAPSGQLLYALNTNNTLLSFYSGTPQFINSAVTLTGVTPGQTIVGTDFRPATGQLIGLGYDAATAGANSQLYVIDLASGAATPLAAAIRLELGGPSDNIGFDFNPLVDRIRVVSTNRANYRLDPNTGGLAATDGTLAYAAGDPNAGATPRIGAVAYTNSFAGTTSTTLFDIDEALSILATQNPPNAGTLNTVGNTTGLTVSSSNALVDLDIFFDAGASANRAFLTANPNGQAFSNLYTLDLGSGSPTLVGAIGLGVPVRDVAAFLAPVVSGLTWTGAVSTDWGTAGNWSPAQVPSATDNVTIPNVANDPVVSNAQQANNVTLASGATLNTANGGVLTLNGSFTNNGGTTLGSGTGEVRFNGAAVQVISGTSTFFNNLTAGPAGITATAPVQVQRVLTLNGNLASNGNLTLLSNATGTAHVINNGAAVVTGNAAVQRYIDPGLNAGAGYRHFSSPVSGTTVADLATPGYTPVVNPAYNSAPVPNNVAPYPTVFGYDETRVTTSGSSQALEFDRGWFSPSSLADPLVVGRGYTVNIPAAQTVDFVGALNNGTVTVGPLTRGSQSQSGWHLLGNPYPAPLNWDLVTRANVDNAVYVYRSTGQYTGTYSTYVANGTGTNGGTNVIGSGQGFFVRVSLSATAVIPQVTFSNAARLTAYASPVFQRGPGTSPLVRLDLRGATGPADEAVIYFEQGATPGFDPALDAYKLPAAGAPVLGLELSNSELLAINALPVLTAADVTVPLRVQVQPGSYTLRAAELLRLPAGSFAYLRDALTGAVVDLQVQPSYSFTVSAGAAAPGRFSLLVTQQRVLATAPAALAQQVSVYPNPARDRVTLGIPAALAKQATEMRLVNALGQTVLRRTVPAQASVHTVALPSLAKGVYTVRLQTAAGVVTKRLVIE